MRRRSTPFTVLSLYLISGCGGGKRECESPGEFTYEGKKAYSCLAENTTENGTKKVLAVKCEKPEFKPFVYEYTTEGEMGPSKPGYVYTCLDETGNIDIPKLSSESSLYCSHEKAGQWLRVSNSSFFRKVYFRCPEYTEGKKIPTKYSDARLAELVFLKNSYRDESFVICPFGEHNVSETPSEVVCAKDMTASVEGEIEIAGRKFKTPSFP